MSKFGIFFIVVVGLIFYGIADSLSRTTSQSRKAASNAKYRIEVGMSDYYTDTYSVDGQNVTFHDVLRNEDEHFINTSFTVKTNQ